MKKKNFNEINIGVKSLFSKTITEADIFAFTGISGDFNQEGTVVLTGEGELMLPK